MIRIMRADLRFELFCPHKLRSESYDVWTS